MMRTTVPKPYPPSPPPALLNANASASPSRMASHKSRTSAKYSKNSPQKSSNTSRKAIDMTSHIAKHVARGKLPPSPPSASCCSGTRRCWSLQILFRSRCVSSHTAYSRKETKKMSNPHRIHVSPLPAHSGSPIARIPSEVSSVTCEHSIVSTIPRMIAANNVKCVVAQTRCVPVKFNRVIPSSDQSLMLVSHHTQIALASSTGRVKMMGSSSPDTE
mmetsp:Transcript_25050/g.58149  ORF Transcript_25050/g.58149 Transcript_25050/m.58149 type:complete len:217 (+) Transcript_25050:1903-2553(+)